MILPPSADPFIHNLLKPQVYVGVCAWCPGAKEATANLAAMGVRVTHGICRACEERFNDMAVDAVLGKDS